MVADNLTWHEAEITRKDHEKRNGHRGAVIWLTGLPASGKSTLAAELQSQLFKRGCNACILDGDNIRHGLNKDLGFSPADRSENIRRVGEVAKLFLNAGFLVITSFISPYRRDRDKVRALLPAGDFIEIYVKANLSVCEKRDAKDLYKKARQGKIKEFTGISAPYEEPKMPELIIDTAHESIENNVRVIMKYLKDKIC